MLTKNDRFPAKVDIKRVISEKRFSKKKDFPHVITENCPFPRKVDIKGVMNEKRFKKKERFSTCDHKK